MSELVDLVDGRGQIQLRAVPLQEAKEHYADGLHLQIAIVVVFDAMNRILIQKRAMTKGTDPGKIDHACGIVSSGESPLETAIRETLEETGVLAEKLMFIEAGLNSYSRWRHLFIGRSAYSSTRHDPHEVAWARFMSRSDLETRQASGDWQFVGEFWEDLDLASQARG